MIKKISALLYIGVLSSIAFAPGLAYGGDEGNGWKSKSEFSIGGGYGLTKLKDDDFDEDEAAQKVFAVFKLNEFIGIEAAYIDFDESSNGTLDIDVNGKAVALILELPVSPNFSAYAKGGKMWWDADAHINAPNFVYTNEYDGNETFWGLGTKFRLSEHLDLRVEYERFNFEISRDEIDVQQPEDIDMDIDYASVNLQFSF